MRAKELTKPPLSTHGHFQKVKTPPTGRTGFSLGKAPWRGGGSALQRLDTPATEKVQKQQRRLSGVYSPGDVALITGP
jgi:hypothetical protein